MTTPNPPLKKQASTEAEAKSIDGVAGKKNAGSGDAKSHQKAGSDHGAGGGKKQKRNH